MITKLAEGVHWIGVVDWGLRHFHGHELSTPRGSTYNSYLIVDEKIVLVDTVWDPFTDQFIEKLKQVVDPAKIDYIVTNHSEVDHSGALPAVMRLAKNATVVVSRKGEESVTGHYHQPWKMKVVKTGDRINIGRRELIFFEATMLHWPDSMFTYLTGDKILMSTDAFGQHYATDFRFNDQVDQDELHDEALKYYVNIVNPFHAQVTKKIDELLSLNLPVDVIAPSHGVIWREEPLQIVDKYKQWAAQTPERSAVIVYETMWHGTRKMAEAIAEGLAAEGVPHKLFYVSVSDHNEILTEIFKAKAVIVGCPTVNTGLIPTITPILESIRGLRFKNKVGAAFGSYGWSGEGIKRLEEHFARCKIPLAAESVKAKWQPSTDDLAACEELGRQVAQAVRSAF